MENKSIYKEILPPSQRSDREETIRGHSTWNYLYDEQYLARDPELRAAIVQLDNLNLAPYLVDALEETDCDIYNVREYLRKPWDPIVDFISTDELMDYILLWYGEYFGFTENSSYRMWKVYRPKATKGDTTNERRH